MAKGKNKTGPRNRDGSPKGYKPKAKEDFSQGNRDNQTSSVSSLNGIRQLIDAGFVIMTDANADYKRGEQQRARKWLRSNFAVENPLISNSGDSVHMVHRDDEDLRITVSVGNMLHFKALDNLYAKTGVRLIADQIYQSSQSSLPSPR